MEELQVRHRKELRDLQNRITQKKKQASKKTRKGVNDECERLEAEVKERHASEIAALNGEDVDGVVEQVDDLQIEEDHQQSVNGIDSHQRENDVVENGPAAKGDTFESKQTKKPNRQKARLARRAAEQDEVARQAAEEARNLPDLKKQERDRMLSSMKERGLHEREIRADGHCLYSAVADQLQQLDIPLGASPDDAPVYKVVRSAAAEYIGKHSDDFVPFLEEPLEEYVHKVRDTGEWGGQLELLALAKTYETDINVLQDFGRVEKISGGGAGTHGSDYKVMWLGYYKHGFGLGEHYNSLRKNG
jgi:OTU domain-containing protein 6